MTLRQAKEIIEKECSRLSVSFEMLRRGVDCCDCSAVTALLARLEKGESITFAQLGGSITEGYFSTAPENSQGGRVFSFLKALYPGQITFVNAGIAATGAVYGAYRLQQDVLKWNPQLVIIEYNINDRAANREGMAAYESIIRILREKGIAVICLFNTVYSDNRECAAGSKAAQLEIAQHYSLPLADANAAFFGEEFYKKSADDGAYFRETDGTHPTDAGHARVGLLICYLLYLAMQSHFCSMPLPQPLIPESLFITDTAQVIKAQQINAGHEKISIYGGKYIPKTQAVGQNIILGADSFSGGTRQSNTYTCYEIPSGESATIKLLGIRDAFIVIMQNKLGSKEALFEVYSNGRLIDSLDMNTHYSGALTVEHSRIINCDHRVYHGEPRDIEVKITARNGNVYVGGVMAIFE